jgi:lipopolysaccharide transport system ATP-binding protein
VSAVITAEAVSKQYRIRPDGPVTLKDLFMRRLAGEKPQSPSKWALRDVSVSVEAGRAFGVIGHNGAGKTTLLRLLCGLGRPTVGRIVRLGRICGLLELGSGFHPDLTGRENIVVGGMLGGFSQREMRAKQEEIIAFAELEDVIDLPTRTYSNGMYLRLAFATAMHSDPAVLVVDEVLAVGDARFQAKCMERLRAFRAAGKTLVLASHVAEQIEALCDEVVVLEEGRVAMQGDPEESLRCYGQLMHARTQRVAARLAGTVPLPILTVPRGSRHGTQEASVAAVGFYDESGEPTASVRGGGALTIALDYTRGDDVADMALSLGIFRDTVKCFEMLLPSVAALGGLDRQGRLLCRIPAMSLLPGTYFVNVGFYPTDWAHVYDYHYQMHELQVVAERAAGYEITGVVSIDPVWSVAQ